MASKTSFPLHSLDEDMLIQILIKIPIGLICRLRQTCSEINEFVEKRKKQMSSRILDPWTFGDYRTQTGVKLRFVVDASEKLKLTVNQEKTSFEANLDELEFLEGIDIHCIYVVQNSQHWNTKSDFADGEQITAILSRLEPKPHLLHLGGIPPEWILKITDVVNARTVSLAMHFGEAEKYLEVLRKARHPEKIKLGISGSEAKFDSVKCFRSFSALAYRREWFHRFLWDMYNSKDENLEMNLLRFSFTKGSTPFNESDVPSQPPSILLWDNKKENPFNRSFRQIELKSKWAIVTESNSLITRSGAKTYTKMISINFVDKNPSAVLDRILEVFGIKDIDSRIREEFNSCSDERKKEIIGELKEMQLKAKEEQYGKHFCFGKNLDNNSTVAKMARRMFGL